LADENSKCAMAICMAPIESEREYLKNKIMRVKTENGWQRHEFFFFNSMVDEKKRQARFWITGKWV